MNKLMQIIMKHHGEEAKTNNIIISTNALDEYGNIIDKRIEKDVNLKVERLYAYNRLLYARWQVKELQLYKRKIAEVNAALEQDDIERVIDAMYFDERREIAQDPRDEELERELERYKSNNNIDIPSSIMRTPEEEKAEARKIYQEKGIIGFQKLVRLYLEICMHSKSIDELLQKAEDELDRVEDIVNSNSPDDPARHLYLTGAGKFKWELKKTILRIDYGIDWKTPAERCPDIIVE